MTEERDDYAVVRAWKTLAMSGVTLHPTDYMRQAAKFDAALARIEAENTRLRHALRDIADEEPTVVDADGLLMCLVRQSDIARQALTAQGQEEGG